MLGAFQVHTSEPALAGLAFAPTHHSTLPLCLPQLHHDSMMYYTCILIQNKFEHIWWNGEDVYQTSQGRPVRVVADELPSD